MCKTPFNKKSAEQVLRQAQDERQVIDLVRGEPVEPRSKPTCSALPKMLAGLFLLTLSGLAGATDRHIQVIAATCMACHGPDGKSRSVFMPGLAGLNASEFLKAMQEFKSGEREASIMKRHAAGYTDAEFEALATYFANLE